jgi:cytochrome c553
MSEEMSDRMIHQMPRPMTTVKLIALAVLVATGISAEAADLGAGKKFATEVCVACHGVDGNSANHEYPKIGGQHPDYLAKALRDYQSGARNNAIMKGFAGMLKSEDIDNVAAWYASQKRELSAR